MLTSGFCRGYGCAVVEKEEEGRKKREVYGDWRRDRVF
jgi:hypothetical protein